MHISHQTIIAQKTFIRYIFKTMHSYAVVLCCRMNNKRNFALEILARKAEFSATYDEIVDCYKQSDAYKLFKPFFDDNADKLIDKHLESSLKENHIICDSNLYKLTKDGKSYLAEMIQENSEDLLYFSPLSPEAIKGAECVLSFGKSLSNTKFREAAIGELSNRPVEYKGPEDLKKLRSLPAHDKDGARRILSVGDLLKSKIVRTVLSDALDGEIISIYNIAHKWSSVAGDSKSRQENSSDILESFENAGLMTPDFNKLGEDKLNLLLKSYYRGKDCSALHYLKI